VVFLRGKLKMRHPGAVLNARRIRKSLSQRLGLCVNAQPTKTIAFVRPVCLRLIASQAVKKTLGRRCQELEQMLHLCPLCECSRLSFKETDLFSSIRFVFK